MPFVTKAVKTLSLASIHFVKTAVTSTIVNFAVTFVARSYLRLSQRIANASVADTAGVIVDSRDDGVRPGIDPASFSMVESI